MERNQELVEQTQTWTGRQVYVPPFFFDVMWTLQAPRGAGQGLLQYILLAWFNVVYGINLKTVCRF